MGRKGENIFHRKDGRWEARYVKGYQSNGKCQYGYLYGKTYQEVKTKRVQYLLTYHEKKNTEKQKKGLFKEQIELWLKQQKIAVKESTFSYYSCVVYKHILPDLGDIPIDYLNEECILSFIESKMDEQKLKISTIHEIAGILKQILSFSNIQIKFKLPKLVKKEIQILSATQRQVLENYISFHLNEVTIGILLSLYTGLRIGEVCALTWGDINFFSGVIKIHKTVSRIQNLDYSSKKTKLVLSTAKTKNSIRFVPVHNKLLYLLKEYKTKKHLEESAYILTSAPFFIDPRNYYNQFKNILKKCELEQFNYHSLRHTFATNCIKEGLDPKSLSELLGHSDIKTTLSFYVHPNMEVKKAFINREVLCPSFLRQNSSQK